MQQAFHRLQVLSRGLRGGVPSCQALCQHGCHGRRKVRHAHVWLRQQACERLLHLRIVPAWQHRVSVPCLQLARMRYRTALQPVSTGQLFMKSRAHASHTGISTGSQLQRPAHPVSLTIAELKRKWGVPALLNRNWE